MQTARSSLVAFLLFVLVSTRAAEPGPLKVLFLAGSSGSHRPRVMFQLAQPALAKAGIDLVYTEDVRDLSAAKLAGYDAVALFKDNGDLPPANEAALLEFVQAGKGLVAIHCSSHCFRNSNEYTKLVGGRFLRHGGEVFRARILDAQHPAMRGVKSFESWDETYVHNQLAADNRVLMAREEQGGYEPYTWVRAHGKGRVFYTALGHDERTWRHEGFHKLLIQGTRWAAGRENERTDLEPFRYAEAKVPNYLAGAKWGTTGAPIRTMQLPLSPAESMKHMHLPEGFRVELFAAEPDLAGKPIAMAWDARGRLWVAETVDYPNERQPEGKGHDRIKILEDTDGDGKADKVTVFAENLSIPTSLAFAGGGVVVSQAPHMLFLQDTDGDDKADVRRVLFTGWGTHDTHAGPSNLRLGLDNWVWGTTGYSGFDGHVGDKAMRFGQGLFRMKPDGSQVEFLASTSNNTWGLGFSEAGDVFASTANDQHSVHLAIPNRYFEGVRGWYGIGSRGIEDHKKFHPITDKVRQVDWHGGFTAAAGHALYTARSFPPEFCDGKAAFVCEPTGHLIHVNRLVPRGSGFVARDGYNIFASDDEWTAPVMAEVGPDGALWFIDWYNFIVQHNPTPAGFRTGKGNAYETPLRDKKHGRIYRIVYDGASRVASAPGENGQRVLTRPGSPVGLDRAGVVELVAALGHDNLWWRQTAQRLLVERGKDDALPALAAVVRDGKNAAAAQHALWTMHGLGAFAADKKEWAQTATAALGSPAAVVRRAALAVLPRNAESGKAILAAKALSDDDAHVRLDALLALSEMPGSKDAASVLVPLLAEPRNRSDRWIAQAVIAASGPSALDFLEAAAGFQPNEEGQRALLEPLRVLSAHVARQAPIDQAGRLLRIVGLAMPNFSEAMLTGLASGWPASKPVRLDEKAAADLASLPARTRLGPGGILQLSALAQRWGQQDKLGEVTATVRKAMLSHVGDEKLSDETRAAAARDLVTLGADKDAVAALLDQITPKTTPTLTRILLDALGQATADEVGPALVQRWPLLTPGARSSAMNVLLRRPAWTRALLAGLEKGDLDRSDLSIDQAQQLARHPDKGIADRAAKLLAGGGRLPNPDRQKVLDAMLPLTKKHGDLARGKAVFEANCAKCHRHGALGQNVGPDLTGVAVRERADILTEILDPNRSVEGNYRQYTVETKKGTLLTGLLANETKTAVELLDSEAKKHVILRDDIENLISSKLSLMPEGFEKLGEADLVSLLDFLSARDKYVPLPLSKAATITSVRGMFNDRANELERLVFPKWGPHTAHGIPFQVLDPRDGTIPNVILLHSNSGAVTREMPKSVSVPCNLPAKTIHLLGGVSGWGFPYGPKDSVSLIVRLHYTGGPTEDHALKNGVHLADYIRVVDVPESKLAFRVRGQQVRYLTVTPKRTDKIERIEFIKGDDATAPVIVAVTVETP